MRTLFSLLLAGALLGGVAACDTGSDGTGRLTVRMTDAPADDFTQANVTVTRVEAVSSDSGRVVVSTATQPFDLLRLRNGLMATLGSTDLPAGRYTQIRVVVADDARVVYRDGTSETLKIPSGTTSGIKVNVPAFTIEDGEEVVVALDFDVNDSFHATGNAGRYIFRPTIKPLYLVVNGDTLRSSGDDD